MKKSMIELNQTINHFLQNSLKLEKELEKKGYPELARKIRRSSSVVTHWVITITGLDKALRDFWKEKEFMGRNIN